MTSFNALPFRKDILKDVVCLVTGGGSGINFGIAEIFGKHGAKVSLLGRRLAVLEKAKEKLESQSIECCITAGDVRNFGDCERGVQKTIETFGKLDILVNGAAGNFICSVEDLSPNAFSSVIQIDLIGTFHMSKAALPHLKLSNSPLVLNISARLENIPYQAHSAAAKAGVDSLTTSMAVEWLEYGIRVVGIAPGPIESTVGFSKLSPPSKMSSTPIKPGKISDIATMALYLATKSANFINGETIVVDGGFHLLKAQMVSKKDYDVIRKMTNENKSKM